MITHKDYFEVFMIHSLLFWDMIKFYLYFLDRLHVLYEGFKVHVVETFLHMIASATITDV